MTSVHHTAIIMIVAVGVAYFVFLFASWNQFQRDRMERDSKIDELLDRISKSSPVTETE